MTIGFLSLHAIAAARGDGLRPELLEELLRQRMLTGGLNVASLEHHRATGFTQAGPNPVGTAAAAETDKVVIFPRAKQPDQPHRRGTPSRAG